MAFMHALWDKVHAFRPGWEKVRKLKIFILEFP